MSAQNNKLGFQFQRGPREKLSVEEAKKRHEDNLRDMEKQIAELNALIKDLEDAVA